MAKRESSTSLPTKDSIDISAEILRRAKAGEEFFIPRVRLNQGVVIELAKLMVDACHLFHPEHCEESEADLYSVESSPKPPFEVTPERLESFALSVETLPSSAHGVNLRKELSAKEWKQLRRGVCDAQEDRCAICKVLSSSLNCHEDWEFDDAAHVLHLRRLVALCDLCHYVKHLGFARMLEIQGKLDFQTVVAHFQTVNGCSRYEFNAHERLASRKWAERDRHIWTVDLGEFRPS